MDAILQEGPCFVKVIIAERIQEHAAVMVPMADAFECRDAAVVAGDGLPVDYARVGS